MSFEEMVVSVIAITGGLAFTTYVFSKIVGLVRSWINRNSSEVPAEDFNRLAKAFVTHKQDAERRIQNLEAIIADEEAPASARSSSESPQVDAASSMISIDERPPSRDHSAGNDSNLRNMLRD